MPKGQNGNNKPKTVEPKKENVNISTDTTETQKNESVTSTVEKNETLNLLEKVKNQSFVLKNPLKANKKLSGPKGIIAFDDKGCATVDFETAQYFNNFNGYTVEG